MRTLHLACMIAAAAATLSACASDNYGRPNRYAENCSDDGNQLGGAVVGGGIGAIAGSAIAGRGDRTAGAVLGGVAGAVAGSELAKSNDRCRNGYYDGQGRRYYYDDQGRPYYR